MLLNYKWHTEISLVNFIFSTQTQTLQVDIGFIWEMLRGKYSPPVLWKLWKKLSYKGPLASACVKILKSTKVREKEHKCIY